MASWAKRRLLEWEIPWLGGYELCTEKPVRVGNAASEQLQLDVYGELADALLHAYLGGIRSTQEDVGLQTALIEDILATIWNTPTTAEYGRCAARAATLPTPR